MANMNAKWCSLYILIVAIGAIMLLYIPKLEPTSGNEVIIPDEAIRLRILANSDSEQDQAVKNIVRDAVNAEITNWVEDLTSLDEARALIQSRLPEIQEIAEQVLADQNVNHDVQVEFGMVSFPTKLYGEYLYPAGEYEAILVTIGEGKGANWWCVLFPPLCFLDFSHGTAVSEGFEEMPSAQITDNHDEQNETNKTELLEKEDNDPEAADETEESEEPQEEPSIQEELEQNIFLSYEVVQEEKTEDGTESSDDEEIENEEDEEDDNSEPKKQTENSDSKKSKEKQEPLFVEDEDDEIKVKFFVVEIFQNLFSR